VIWDKLTPGNVVISVIAHSATIARQSYALVVRVSQTRPDAEGIAAVACYSATAPRIANARREAHIPD
jgi:hypothetical protein